MAWGSSKTPKAKPSTLSQLIPLVIFFVVLAGAAWVGYQIYLSFGKMQETASQRMGKKNVVFTKDGVRVGVKQVQNEKYVDTTQSWFVKTWNLGKDSKENESTKTATKKKHT